MPGMSSSFFDWKKEKTESTPDCPFLRPPPRPTSVYASPAARCCALAPDDGSTDSFTDKEMKKPKGTSHELRSMKPSTVVTWWKSPKKCLSQR